MACAAMASLWHIMPLLIDDTSHTYASLPSMVLACAMARLWLSIACNRMTSVSLT